MPRWVRMVGILVLFICLVGALVAITTMLLHHRNRLVYRIIVVLWTIGTFCLLLIVGKGWSILRETDVLRDW
jgi:hypothetical protein